MGHKTIRLESDIKNEKACAVRKLIANENKRHGRKTVSLNEQKAVAQKMQSEDQKILALTRLKGQLEDEAAKHRDRLTILQERLMSIFR